MTRCCCLLSKFEVLGSLDAQLLLGLTFFTFKTKDDLTRGFGLLVEDGLGLPTETHLLGVITSLSLRKVGGFSGLVLGDLVEGVLLALTRTVCLTFLGYVHHDAQFYNLKMGSKRRESKLNEQDSYSDLWNVQTTCTKQTSVYITITIVNIAGTIPAAKSTSTFPKLTISTANQFDIDHSNNSGQRSTILFLY